MTPAHLTPDIAQALHARDRDSILLADEHGTLSTRDAIRFTEQFVDALTTTRIPQHPRLAVVLPNGRLLALTGVAAMSSATFAPLDPRLTAPEFEVLLKNLHADALVSAGGFSPSAHEAARRNGLPILDANRAGEWEVTSLGTPGRPRPDDASPIALLLHTSGTTARPKLVGLSAENLMSSARSIAATVDVGPADRCLNVMPLFHIHGLVGVLLTSLVAGASVRTTEGFDSFAFVRMLSDPEVSWTSAVPSMYNAVLLRSQGQFVAPGLRLARSSSAPLPSSLASRLETLLDCPVINSYGMTEASHQMASNAVPPGKRQHGTVGCSAGAEIAILRSDTITAHAGVLGEVVVRGPGLMEKYLAPAEANDTAWHGDWFRTGDLGSLDAEGYLTLHGRIKEIINVAGEKVSPYEVEAVLLDHPSVADVAVFGAPDRLRGEQVCAVVVPKNHSEPPTVAQLRDHATERLATFKAPRRFVIAESIPLGPTGKIQRSLLAQRFGLDSLAPARAISD